MVLAAISAPALAQTTPPPAEDAGGLGGLSPGAVALGAAGIGLAVWGISAATKKSSTTTPACTSAC
jgi:hypothetical protein